jgi:macrolide transport system ATP-binding/permease protein
MKTARGAWVRLRAFFGRRRYAEDLADEMEFHRAQAEQELVRNGMSRENARYAAMRQFGNAALLKERSVEVVGFRFESVAQDVRFAVRQLRRQPGFALLTIAILALGIGASVAIFAFVDAALLEPLPYANSNRLMDVGEKSNVHRRSNLSYEDFLDWKRMNRSFNSLDAYTGTGFLLRTSSGTEPVQAARVTAGFFDTLGVKPLLGRGFRVGEDRPGAGKVVMLTYGAWMKRYGARGDIVGQSLQLDSDNYTIIGVLPRDFSFAPRGAADLWVPISDLSQCEKRRGCHNLFAVGRLRDGVTEASALADLQAIAAQLERMYPGTNKGQGANVQPLAELIIGFVRPILLTLLGGSLLLLVIASVNVSSLMLVRSEGRRREIAVRGAVGATHTRLLRQFVTEGFMLSAAGTLAGVAVAVLLMELLTRLIPKQFASSLPLLNSAGLNAHTLAFAGGVAIFTALLLSLTPALRLGFQQIHHGLAEGGRGTAGRMWQRLGANLVVVELAVAVVLLVGAGLLGKSLYRLLHVDMGFDDTHLAMATVQIPRKGYEQTSAKIALYRVIEERLGALPGVQSVAITSDIPVLCFCNTDWIRIVGKPFNGEHNEVVVRDVSPSYVATLRARLIRGRTFRDDDDESKPRVIVINEALARKYFPGEDPIGKQIGDGGLSPTSLREIVGVIGDIREGALDDEMIPGEYSSILREGDSGFTTLVRTSQDEKSILLDLVRTIHNIDPNLGVYGETTMTDAIESTQPALLHRLSTWLVGGFAAIALALSVVGLYGVIAYSVSQRTREIGVRMALGAQRSAVYALVMSQAAKLTSIGVAAGLLSSVGTSLLIRKLLFGVGALDVPTLTCVTLVLGAASLAASFVPAHRAAGVNPTEALRAE